MFEIKNYLRKKQKTKYRKTEKLDNNNLIIIITIKYEKI